MNVAVCLTNAGTWGRGTTQSEAVFNAFRSVSGSSRPTEMRVLEVVADRVEDVTIDPMGNLNTPRRCPVVSDLTIEVSRGLFQTFDHFYEMLSDTLLDAELEADDAEE